MKKILYIITIFFMMISSVLAKDDLIITDLKIKNGTIAPKFDKYNNYYSVTISEDVKKLEIEYEYDEEKYEVEVVNNDNLVKNKLVYLSVYEKETKEQNTYIFKIYIETTKTTANVVEDVSEITEEKEKTKNYAPIIGSTCFILIILVYYLMFLR